MKKETTMILTVELTKHFNGGLDMPTEEFKQSIKEQFLAEIKRNDETFDNINIANVQFFELEKEERISTEDLIMGARYCIEEGVCRECPIAEECRMGMKLTKTLADRLEELYNKQIATPTEQKEKEYSCTTCKYVSLGFEEEPCITCVNAYSKYSKWERA